MEIRHRTYLTRRWADSGPMGVFIMLNPSTADDLEDDPTIRRCIGFAKRLGWAGFYVVNLFTMRATKPCDLYAVLREDPNKANDTLANVEIMEAMEAAARSGGQVVAAWGAHANKWVADRSRTILRSARIGQVPLWCLGTNKDGSPKHPLYLRADAPLTVYQDLD